MSSLGRMCHSCVVSKRKIKVITYASGHRMLQGDRSLMKSQARFFVYGPDCRRDLSEKKEHGPRYARGTIRWETNSTKLVGLTANWESAKLWRRSYLREISCDSQGFRAVVVKVILKGLKMQMIEDGSLHTVEAFASGPLSGVP